jgi:hypothetical protein
MGLFLRLCDDKRKEEEIGPRACLSQIGQRSDNRNSDTLSAFSSSNSIYKMTANVKETGQGHELARRLLPL